MPKDTFFRLPREKRERIIEAAGMEFRRVPYGDTSINRIIKTAEIPRGSFYQYFEDKHDLFLYCLSKKYEEIMEYLRGTLVRCGGDCFRFIDALTDRFTLFYREKGQEGLMVSLADENLFAMIFRENCGNKVYENVEREVSDSLISRMNFDEIAVNDEQEQLYLLDILWAVISSSIRTVFRKGKDVSLEDEIRKMRERIRSIEKHYRINA